MNGQWEIFCKVIDNYGDVGVCWRLCCDLASRGQAVRLWIDDAAALAWMAPEGCPGVEVVTWPDQLPTVRESLKKPSNCNFYVIIESFGCEIDPEFIANCAINTRTLGTNKFSWINLEYISAEKYAERNHQLPSPVLTGPARGLTKHFFYPGFTPRTGGLLREPGLLDRQTRFAAVPWPSWLAFDTVSDQKPSRPYGEQWISLFCYEPMGLGSLLAQLAAGPGLTRLLVTHGRAQRAVAVWVSGHTQSQSDPASATLGALRICYLPALTQIQYDELLWVSDFNLVRGEDSLVRALWAGKPFVWHIYPQDDGAHHAKLEAFLHFLGASDSLVAFHRAWNQQAVDETMPSALPLPTLDLAEWGAIALQARERLLQQPDLTTQLMQFVASQTIGSATSSAMGSDIIPP
jgi:uncharacterized repeat protein (TIGR03837 family)